MALQSAPILIQPAFGIAGEQAFNYPNVVALSYALTSSAFTLNIVGAICCSVTGTNPLTAAAGNVGGALPFAGFLCNPKNYINFHGDLTATMTLPNGTQVSLATQGAFNVILTNTPVVGNQIVFDNTTGLMTGVAAGSVLASGKSWANAKVYSYSGSGAGICVAIFSPQVPVSYTPAS